MDIAHRYQRKFHGNFQSNLQLCLRLLVHFPLHLHFALALAFAFSFAFAFAKFYINLAFLGYDVAHQYHTIYLKFLIALLGHAWLIIVCARRNTYL